MSFFVGSFIIHENTILREQHQQFLRGQGQIPNGVEGQDQHGRLPGVQSRGSRNSGGARPQSMFEPRNQERLSQKSNKVCNSSDQILRFFSKDRNAALSCFLLSKYMNAFFEISQIPFDQSVHKTCYR